MENKIISSTISSGESTFHSNHFKLKSSNYFKSVLIWLLLVVFPLSNLSIQGNIKIVKNDFENGISETIDLNSGNEQKPETTFTDITDSTSTYGPYLTKVENGNKSVEYAVLQIEFVGVSARRKKFTDLKNSNIDGVTVLTTIDRFADVFVDTRKQGLLTRIFNDPTVLRAEWTNTIKIPPPPPLIRTKYGLKGTPEVIVRNGFTDSQGLHLTGKNVVIAVVDTGIDFTHPDFIKYDEDGNPTSRLLYLWDSTLEFVSGRGEKASFLYPNKTSIGTVFTQEQLTAELRARKAGKTPKIPSTDENGHGTACASIAAGNGSADFSDSGLHRSDVAGVAPDALLIGVRIGKGDSFNTYLLNAICEWLDKIAGENPLVVSASFGGNYTGHDGQSVSERALNKRFENGDKKGRSIVAAAGNEAQSLIHAYVTFGNRKSTNVVSWNAKKSTEIRMYLNRSYAKHIKIAPLENTTIKKGQLSWELNKITNQIQMRLKVTPGQGKIRLYNSTGQKTEAHLYFNDKEDGAFIEGVDQNYLVTSPGTAESFITVGGSQFNNNFHSNGKFIELTSSCKEKEESKTYLPLQVGILSCYSSPGPTRDKRYKPDVVAPSEWFTASYASGSTGWKKEFLDSSGKYVPMNGTSAATPYVAGIIALLFERNSNLTTNQIKDLFRKNLTKSNLKPELNKFPNENWGNGKIDLPAIERIIEAVNK